ncbi:MAG: hypothetical protein QGG71_25630 [Pirellulaceae bacterium]|nr:hypothetical protein [Pirellulaceae bacterium]
MKLSHLPFFMPCISMWFADVVGTLVGQSSGYWLGDYSQAYELNPLFRPLLVIGPGAFVLGAIASLAVFIVVVRRLNLKMATSILFLATLIHFFGAATWIVQTPHYGILLLVILGLVIKIQLEHDWRRFAAIRGTT